jgi:branched-chain amino acid transport system ATP-binding protein
MLQVTDLAVGYGRAQVLFDLSLEVAEGNVLALLGPNGAGKSTLARALTGLVSSQRGEIVFDGMAITNWPAYRIRRAGLVHIPEGKGVFPGLSVDDNLQLAVRREPDKADALDRALSYFPPLATRRRQRAGSLSGGEQQMLALARALAVRPRMIIADEISLGLAPLIVEEVFRAVDLAREEGITILLIEQFVSRALAISDQCVILVQGSVAWSGTAASASDEDVFSRYLERQRTKT